METFVKKLDYKENHSIIGDDDQLLQVLLFKFDSFVTKKEYLNYFSSNLETKNVENQSIRKAERNGLIVLYNQTSSLCYTGIYGSGGKILKIMPALYTELYILYDCLLGFSKGIELSYDNELNQKSFSNKVFYKIKNEKASNLNYNSLSITDIRHLNEYVYLQNKNHLIEKRLGKNEEINLLYNSVIAFEGTIQFKSYLNAKNKLFPYFVAEGPGLIIFQTTRSKEESLHNRSNKFLLLFLIALIVAFSSRLLFLKYYSN